MRSLSNRSRVECPTLISSEHPRPTGLNVLSALDHSQDYGTGVVAAIRSLSRCELLLRPKVELRSYL